MANEDSHPHHYRTLFFVELVLSIVLIANHVWKSTFSYSAKNTDGPCHCQQHITGIDEAAFCLALQNATLGPLSNCSLADVMIRPGVMLLTTTNLGYLDVTLNMLESIKQTGLCLNTTIIAEDQKVYSYLRTRAVGDPAIHVFLTNSGETGSKEIWQTDLRRYYGFFKQSTGVHSEFTGARLASPVCGRRHLLVSRSFSLLHGRLRHFYDRSQISLSDTHLKGPILCGFCLFQANICYNPFCEEMDSSDG